jgi:hypothetical protein
MSTSLTLRRRARRRASLSVVVAMDDPMLPVEVNIEYKFHTYEA